MALYRLVCALGQHSLVAVLMRGGLPLLRYLLADEKHSRCLTAKVDLPTIVRGRVIWHLGYSESKSATAFTESYGGINAQPLRMSRRTRYGEPSPMALTGPSTVCRPCFQERVWGIAAPRAQQAPCKLIGVSASVRQALRAKFHTLLHRCRQHKSLRVVALGQRLRRCADHISNTVGEDHGKRVRNWFREKKSAGMRYLKTRKCRR